jgi:hypothetical protein
MAPTLVTGRPQPSIETLDAARDLSGQGDEVACLAHSTRRCNWPVPAKADLRASSVVHMRQKPYGTSGGCLYSFFELPCAGESL